MSIKSIFLSTSFVLISAVSFAGNEVQPLDVPANVITVAEADEACTMSGTISNGSVSVDVSVTASDCAGAAAGLAAIAKAIDEM